MNIVIKITLFIAVFVVYLFSVAYVHAHPGNTDYLGCHTCYTNCSSWRLNYFQYHCHSPKVPIIPSCPYMSYYSYSYQQCVCYSGYIASGGQCISKNQYCINRYGWNYYYNYLYNTCVRY